MATSTASIMAALDDMSVQDLVALIQAAEEKRGQKLEAAKQALVDEFRAKASELGLSAKTMFGGGSAAENGAKGRDGTPPKLPAKYRGPNGEEWTGRGRLPKWLIAMEAAGRKRLEFLLPG